MSCRTIAHIHPHTQSNPTFWNAGRKGLTHLSNKNRNNFRCCQVKLKQNTSKDEWRAVVYFRFSQREKEIGQKERSISENVTNKWGRRSCVPFICNTFCPASWPVDKQFGFVYPVAWAHWAHPLSAFPWNWRSFYLFRIVAWYKWLAINASWVYCLCSLACGKRIIEKGHSADDIRVPAIWRAHHKVTCVSWLSPRSKNQESTKEP